MSHLSELSRSPSADQPTHPANQPSGSTTRHALSKLQPVRPRLQLVLWSVVGLTFGILIPLPSHYSPTPTSRDQQALQAALNKIRTIDVRPRILGYSRQRFGSGWASHTTADGRYCTTRQLLLQAAFSPTSAPATLTNTTADSHTDAATGSPSTTDCRIRGQPGVGPKDPYTGAQLRADHVDVDHIVPLSAAWDLGAYRWDEGTRVRFANDMQWNLVVVDSTVNRDKSDATLSAWMPPSAKAHCPYAARFVAIVARYQLALPKADVDVARKACDVKG